MIKAVIIDLDDTLVLTEATSFAMENAILAQMGRPSMVRKVHLETWHRPPLEAIATRSPGIDIECYRSIYEPMVAECIRSGVLDVIPESNFTALEELRRQGKIVLVLTSRTHAGMQHILESDHRLKNSVQAFYYRDTLRFRKPDPRVFTSVLSDMSLVPEQCIYIGDALGDARAAKKAGLFFIASLESGLRKTEDFEGLEVDAFINTFPEVVSAVRTLEHAM